VISTKHLLQILQKDPRRQAKAVRLPQHTLCDYRGCGSAMRVGYDQYVFVFHLVEQLESFVEWRIYSDTSVVPAERNSLDCSRMSETKVASHVSGGMSRRNISFPVDCSILAYYSFHICTIFMSHSTCQRMDRTIQWLKAVGCEPSKGFGSRTAHVVVRLFARRVTRDEQRVQ
jgi:hypothetical protein